MLHGLICCLFLFDIPLINKCLDVNSTLQTAKNLNIKQNQLLHFQLNSNINMMIVQIKKIDISHNCKVE